MINTDEDALICDLAEVYNVYDYRSLPCKLAAAFSCGLRDDSRIKMKLSGMKVTTEQMLLAVIVDGVRTLTWFQSRDGMEGTNRPKSVLGELLETEEQKDIETFENGDEFDKEWRRLTGGEC